MKTPEQIIELAEKYIQRPEYNGSITEMKRTAYITAYTAAQQEMSKEWVSVEDVRNISASLCNANQHYVMMKKIERLLPEPPTTNKG